MNLSYVDKGTLIAQSHQEATCLRLRELTAYRNACVRTVIPDKDAPKCAWGKW